MPSFPSHPRPRHKPCFARAALRRCLPALCLGLVIFCAAPPASAASLHEFVTRWGKTTVSSWPPPEENTTVPAAENTRQPAAESGTNATSPVTEPHTTTPAATTDQGQAMRGAVHDAVMPTAGETHKPAAESAQNAATSAQAEKNRPQPPPAHPTPEARQPGTLPDDMPSSLLGNANLHAPKAPPAQQYTGQPEISRKKQPPQALFFPPNTI